MFRRAKLDTVHALLTQRFTPFEQRLYRRLVEGTIQNFRTWQKQNWYELRQREKHVPKHARKKWREDVLYGDRRNPQRRDTRQLLDYLVIHIGQELRLLDELRQSHDEYRNLLSLAPTEPERQRVMLEFAKRLGATPPQLRADAKAFSRWLTAEVLTERFLRRRGQIEQYLAFAFDRLAQLTRPLFTSGSAEDSPAQVFKRLDIERLVVPGLSYQGDPRVATAVLRCLSEMFLSLDATQAAGILSVKTLSLVSRLAIDTEADVWLQSAAIEILARIEPASFARIAEIRLNKPSPADDLFVRKRIVGLLGAERPSHPSLPEWIAVVAQDLSPFVRQELARMIWNCDAPLANAWIQQLATSDAVPQVRAAVLVASLDNMERRELRRPFFELLGRVLESDPDVFARRVALHVTGKWVTHLASGEQADDDAATHDVPPNDGQRDLRILLSGVLPTIDRLRTTANPIPLRRWAACVAERIWYETSSRARSLAATLAPYLDGLEAGQARKIPAGALADFDEELIGRTLAVLAQEDFGIDLGKRIGGYRIVRGTVFRFRLWRLLHELRHPATDKRQAFRHTVGRWSGAEMRAPSGVMAEMSPTKVPGEPLLIAAEGTWRPFLPLVDDFLSILGTNPWRRRDVRFFSAEGITSVRAPTSLWRRWRAFVQLTDNFAQYAQWRNWDVDSSTTPDEYLRRMAELGFQIRFTGYATDTTKPNSADGDMRKFFPALVGILGLPGLESIRSLGRQYTTYFTSAFENTLTHLAIFIAVCILFLVVKHGLSNHWIRRARRQVPLCVGGWGTRGKSGTERLKAALFNALGSAVFSKSTGCEAMFLHSQAHGRLREIPLFRPYDKATIWEHANILGMASRLRPDVFLWECMGLTPDYVNVLQHQWTRDDLSTITNAYPDHEDIQGPAGHNVARVISGFVPRRARLLTTEQQMRPLITESCRRSQTTLGAVGWLESGMITDDILSRFPYREHPDNIALVLALADEFHCPRDFALKAMADEMVADLGVLKTFPPAQIRSRTLEFTNGMSANERFGTLGNWQRLAFDQHDPAREPGTWICSIVNNRADRVARSRVFAQILVKDLQADRHFLIGTNLKGLSGFIWESWDEEAREMTLWPAGKAGTREVAIDTLDRAARRFRQAVDEPSIRRALTRVLRTLLADNTAPEASAKDLENCLDLWRNPDQLASQLKSFGTKPSLVAATEQFAHQLLTGFQEYTDLRRQIEAARPGCSAELDQAYRTMLRGWFARKIVVIDDSAATGEQIIHRICEETPPGYFNRLMGIQNIKGTGLDFVYTWQTWDEIHAACQLLVSANRATVQLGLQQLSAIPVLGQLSEHHLKSTVEQARRTFETQRENLQAEFDDLLQRLGRSLKTIADGLQSTERKRSTLGSSLIKACESFLDTQDAIRRRKTADQIYRDLEDERISPQRAVIELRNLNKRQKGGWLKSSHASH